MTFKKVLGLIVLACLTIIGLSACTPDKEPTWTYDKNKMQFVGQDASVQVLSATKIESPEGQKAIRVHYKLSNTSKETMNAYALLMKVVLDVKQEKEELKVATMVFSKDDDRDKIANKTKIDSKEVKEIIVDYAVSDFDHDLIIEFSDYGTEADATAHISLKNLENAPVKYFDNKSQ
ncbi:DUF5067 domain-containing protein [Streptococcus thermophilus]|uniref:DUF5067 domain-containing protein n=1 Tax=Streptococcus thermophilus TaxID=1308 RepID=UPI003A7FF703